MHLNLVVGFLLSMMLLGTGCTKQNNVGDDMLIYTGTYTEADSQGIELYACNKADGRLRFVRTAAQTASPSYIRISPDGGYLYAVNELVDPAGKLSAFKIDAADGSLRYLNSLPSDGRAPCYLEVSRNGKFVLFNNYLDGVAGVQTLTTGGQLGQPAMRLQFAGSGPNSARQEAAHVHSITLDPQNTFAVVADLGTDKLSLFRFDAAVGGLEKVSEVQTAPGAGPRHSCFTANGQTLFVANELNSTVEVFAINRESESLKRVQTISTLPQDFSGKNFPADIHLSPDQKFLYVSNRGHESLALFRVREGKLNLVGTIPVGGSWPRNFTISKDGKWLIVANQKSRNLVVFKRDLQSGRLTMTGQIATIASPACVKIYD